MDEIKKIVKDFRKQSPSDQAISQFHSKYLRPLDRLLSSSIVGSEAFREATGLSRKWLDNIKAVDTKMNGRMNNNIVILKVYK